MNPPAEVWGADGTCSLIGPGAGHIPWKGKFLDTNIATAYTFFSGRVAI
jgi:hypothetical protein